ncbi:hypothetical protein [Cellulomonas sp. KRMCY2]|uniref:hypothetical protein n=1 Tax=Cellulomonas sp. KRMCY2 TaxID=1304865 RepID=UPI00045E58F4|nr:hypothetical protein [Cellulomonas sp. KRMCY2]
MSTKPPPYCPIALDVAIMAFLLNAGHARAHQIVAWTAASGPHVAKRLGVMGRAGVIRKYPAVPRLTVEGSALPVPSPTIVYGLTGRARAHLGPVEVAGSGAVVQLGLMTGPPKGGTLDHSLAMVDLAIWYRMYGAQIAWERQIIASERESTFTPSSEPYWTAVVTRDVMSMDLWVRLTGGRRQTLAHQPDLGVVLPGGQEVVVEAEISPKSAERIQMAIRANNGRRDSSRWQAWHIYHTTTRKRMRVALRGREAQYPGDPGVLPGMFYRFMPDLVDGVGITADLRFRTSAAQPGPAVAPELSTLTVEAAWAMWPNHHPMGLGQTEQRGQTDWSAEWRTGPNRTAEVRAAMAAKVKATLARRVWVEPLAEQIIDGWSEALGAWATREGITTAKAAMRIALQVDARAERYLEDNGSRPTRALMVKAISKTIREETAKTARKVPKAA